MSKIGQVMIVVGAVIGLYLVLLIVMPILSDMASTANTTIAATSNITNYPGTTSFLLSTPWILFFAPGTIGMIAIIIILRQP